ncbi:MAG: HNH endonuclease [Arcobacter sp.]|uniref:HNH endonuclease n=1 Tax=Arcobacter sp. TaxID=1872629 RepID=UPI003C78996C
MKENTLNNAILMSLRELNTPSNYKDVYKHIILNNYYNFKKAKTPWSTVNALLSNLATKKMYLNKNVGRKKIKGLYHYFFKNMPLIENTHKTKELKSIWKVENLQLLENSIEIIDNDYSVQEGKSKYRRHLVRERDSKIIKLAKIKFKKEIGKLHCEICGFDFEKTYGQIGTDFIEGHHNIGVSELKENQKTRIEDISLVCSNCHKILHRRKPWLTVEELKNLIKK